MRQQGTLTTWHDQKGYGFITPEGGGPAVFVHISSFHAAPRRPRAQDRLLYLVETAGKKRPEAKDVLFVGESASARRLPVARAAYTWPLGLLLIFEGALAAASLLVRLSWLVLGVSVCASLISYALYALDKRAAVAQRRRIPESTLHFWAGVGGWPGALLAQSVYRHKTRKQPFRQVFWFTVGLHLVGVLWLLANPGVLPF